MAVDFGDLTIPGERGARSLRALLNRVWPTYWHAYQSLGAHGEATRVFHAQTRRTVDRQMALDPRPVLLALRRPPTAIAMGEAIRCMRSAASADAHIAEVDCNLVADLAARGLLPGGTVPITRPGDAWPIVRGMNAGRAWHLDPAVESWVVSNGAVVDPHVGATETAYVPLGRNVSFATTDNNPDVRVSLHPERPQNTLDLGGRSVVDWTSALSDAFAIVHEHLPEIADEMDVLLQLIVPVGSHDERHFSCSYENALGAIYLSLHPSVMTLAEALVHEFQHNKFHAALRTDDILANSRDAKYASPLRPDPRPLIGVLMAVHAYLPIALLYRRMTQARHPLARSRDWALRLEQIESVNRDGITTVRAGAQPTVRGRALIDGMLRT